MNKNTIYILDTLQQLGISLDDAYALRRISMTLHRWHELECGAGDDQTQVSVERDDESKAHCLQCDHRFYGEAAETANCPKCGDPAPIRIKASGKCYQRIQYPTAQGYVDRRHPIADRETGALKRLKVIMARYPELSAYVQTDPRDAALYILRPGDVPEGKDVDAYYSRGIAVYK